MESRVIWETALRNESHILVIIVCDVCQIGVTERQICKAMEQMGKDGGRVTEQRVQEGRRWNLDSQRN